MKASNANKVVSVLLSIAMCPMMVPSAAFAADDDAASGASSPTEQAQSADQAEGADTGASSSDTIAPQSESADASTGEAAAPAATATVNGYSTLEDAVQNATVDTQGVITYEVTGKVNVNSTGWVQVRPATATNAKVVKFVGKSADAEICITQGAAILADQESSALSVEFSNLTLSKLNPKWAQDFGHSTNYFTTWLRNTDAASNCVTYTNCEFPNGVCNNQYGKTVFDSCTFSNATSGLYSMWVYGGNVEVKGGSFTGVRGVKVFTEGTATVAPKVAIEGTSFKGVSEKAAIVVSKPAAVTLSNVSATDCAKGLIQKAIEGSSEKVTLNANGTGIGGSFDITANTGSDAAKAEFNLNAGTLTTEVSSDYLADGSTLSNNGDGTYGVAEAAPAAVAEVKGVSYPSLQAAIDDAPRNATVKLLADTYENVTISANAITLDLNGHTLNGGTVKAKPALTIDNTRVTVQDSSEAQTGTIMREDTAENSGVSSHYVIDVQGGSGFLLFNSGTVKNNSGTANGAKGASLVRVGNDSNKKAHPTVTIAGGTFTQDNFIAIKVDFGTLYVKGGVVNSKNSYAIENWLNANIKDNAVINGNVSSWTYAEGSNSNLNISGGTVNGNVESVTYDGAEGKTAKVSITGGTVNGSLSAKKYNSTETNDPAKATIEVTGGTFSTDPSRYLIESSTATQNADGTYGVAKAYLAKVGESSYYTMDEAFKAQTASGEAITLLRDYTTGGTFNSGTVARVVDLNGHTWTCTGTDANSAAFEINNPNASLTVKNGKVVSSQLIGLIPSAMGGTITYDNSTLTFEGVEASTTATSGIEANGNNTNDTVVLKDSTLNVPNGFGIYFPSSGTLTIDNSTINAKTMGAQVCSGNLNVTAGSVITVSGDPVAKTEGDGAIQDGAAISIVNRTGYKGLGQIAIAGGTFTAKGDNAAIKAYTWDSATKQESAFDNSAKTVAVSGGTFSSAVASDLCAEGCTPIANADGTYGVASGVAYVAGKSFDTLQAAIDAAQDGETVTLLADATEDVAISKSITLDLGGKTLTNTNAGNATISVTSGTVTVKNGNVVGGTGYYNIEVTKNSNANLTLTDVTATAGNTGSSMIDNWGTMTITSGTYTGGLDVVKSEEGSKLTITGGTFTLNYATNGYTGVIFAYGDTTISGGEFIQNVTTTGRWNHPQVVATGVVEGYTSITRVTGGHFVNKMSGEGIFRGIGKGTSDNFEVSGGTFNKSISEGFCADGFIPTKNADGTYGVKEGHYVAQVGSTKYETLADAIRLAAKGKTITLLTDVEQNTQLTISKNITLDLNGKTIKNTQDIWGEKTNAILSITNGAKVTITGDGTIDAKENDCYTINVVKGDLTIENGTFYGNVSVVQVQEGTLSVKGGTFDLHQKWEGSSKYLFNCIDDAYANGSANVAISGGTFVGFDLNVSPEGEGTSYLAPGYAPVDNGDGTYGVVAGVAQIGTKAYTSLQAAIDAAQAGDAVQLLADTKENVTISANDVTLDLNGHTLNGSTGERKPALTVMSKATIVDSSEAQTGTIMREDTAENSGVSSHYVIDVQGEGDLLFESGTVKNGSGAGGTKGASLVRIGTDSKPDALPTMTVAGGTFTQDNFIALKVDYGTLYVKGGTINSANSYAVQNWKNATIEGGTVNGNISTWTYSGGPGAELTISGGTVNGDIESLTYDGVAGNPAKVAITGGTVNGSLHAIDYSTHTTTDDPTKATIDVAGGTFANAVPANYCAEGYVPTANADNTYGVKLAEGAYLLQDYRSGNQTSWTYPTQEGMAFAGWYKDAAFTTACTASDVEGAAYAKFVPITDLLQYKGGSLRMDVAQPSELTWLRFGYTMALPEGASFVENGWYFKKVSTSQPTDVRRLAKNNVLNIDGTITANLVFTGVTTNYYSANFSEKAFVKYVTADGTTVEAVESDYQVNSVLGVAEVILAHPMASKAEKDYATQIKAAV